ncbi:MAG: polysaccharide deacetylase family protein [Mycobacteriaceae bacterium]
MVKLFSLVAALVFATGLLFVAGGVRLTSNARPVAVRPLNNDAAAGRVVITFDDGPGTSTQTLLDTLNKLHLHVIFFDIGQKVQDHPALVRAEQASGDVLANHTWDHPDLPMLTNAQVNAEFRKTGNEVAAVGVPKPTLWKPPYGNYTITDRTLASGLGLQLVPFVGFPGCLDSRDWTGAPTRTIVDNVIHGYYDHGVVAPIQNGTLLTFHDGAALSQFPTEANMIAALQSIVDFMNAHHLGVTVNVNTSPCVRAGDGSASGLRRHNNAG